jgi:hypothetical protein
MDVGYILCQRGLCRSRIVWGLAEPLAYVMGLATFICVYEQAREVGLQLKKVWCLNYIILSALNLNVALAFCNVKDSCFTTGMLKECFGTERHGAGLLTRTLTQTECLWVLSNLGKSKEDTMVF